MYEVYEPETGEALAVFKTQSGAQTIADLANKEWPSLALEVREQEGRA